MNQFKKKYILIKASAGSGKTYSISSEYISFILKHPDEIKNVLAITFTNKAASEMKNRILNLLKSLTGTGDENKNFKKQISSILDIDENKIMDLGKSVLERILYAKEGNGFADFSVMTIDSFSNRLVRIFSDELDISPSYQIGFNVKNVMKMYIEDLISKISNEDEEGKNLKDIFLNYLLYRVEEGKSLDVEDEVLSTIFSIRDKEKNFDLKIDVRENEWLKNVKEAIVNVKSFKNSFYNYCNRIKEISNRIGEGNEFLKNKSRNLISFIKNFVSEQNKYEIDYIIEKDSFKNFYNSSFDWDIFIKQYIDYENLKCEHVETKLEELFKELKNFKNFLHSNLLEYFQKKIYLKNIYANILYDKVDKLLNNYQKRKDIIFIDELNSKVKSLFKDETDIPFVYFLMGEKYKKFLIDEFQDTSIKQWNNLKPLIENGVSEGFNCIMVGDDKQAIYRFRGGSTEIIKEFGKRDDVEIKNLEYNRRSCKTLVEFYNEFFKEIKFTIENYEEQKTESKEEGYVEINIISGSLKDEMLEEGDENKILEIIRDAMERGYEQKSIAILVRTGDEGNKIAQILTGKKFGEENLKIISSDTLFIKDNPYVFFIISLIRFILSDSLKDFTDTLYAFKDMNIENSNFKESEKLFLEKIQKKGINYEEILKKLWGEEIYENYEKRIKKSINFITPYEIITRVIEYIMNPLSIDYSTSISHILKLLDEAFLMGKEGGIKDFLDYYDEYKDQIKIASPSNQNAITISTIHKSKGLEYDIVIIPFANWDDKKKLKDSFFIDEIYNQKIAISYSDIKKKFEFIYNQNDLFNKKKNEEEKIFYDDLNLLYVAFTRAKKELYVFTESPKKNKNDENDKTVSKLISSRLKKTTGINDLLNYKKGEKTEWNETEGDKKETKVVYTKLSKMDLCSHEKDLFIDRSFKSILNRENVSIKNGEVLHKILSRIYTKDDLDNSLDLALVEGLIDIGERVYYKNIIKEFFNNEKIARFFQNGLKVYNEREICFNGKILRPDRVIFEKDFCYIVDYKSGLKKKNDILQVKEYMIFFSKRVKNVKGYIIYLQNFDILEVKDEIS